MKGASFVVNGKVSPAGPNLPVACDERKCGNRLDASMYDAFYTGLSFSSYVFFN